MEQLPWTDFDWTTSNVLTMNGLLNGCQEQLSTGTSKSKTKQDEEKRDLKGYNNNCRQILEIEGRDNKTGIGPIS